MRTINTQILQVRSRQSPTCSGPTKTAWKNKIGLVKLVTNLPKWSLAFHFKRSTESTIVALISQYWKCNYKIMICCYNGNYGKNRTHSMSLFGNNRGRIGSKLLDCSQTRTKQLPTTKTQSEIHCFVVVMINKSNVGKIYPTQVV